MGDQVDFVLPNRLKVVLVERPFGKGFAACLNFRAGSQEDPIGKMGLAHLTEHLTFTGRTRALAEELTEQSVYVNGSTAQQRTAYFVSGHSTFLVKGLQLLASVLEPREIEPKACLQERKIVHQEMVDNEPDSLCERTAAYWKLHSRLSGDPNWRSDYQQQMASVKKLTNDAVNGFRKEHYHPADAALAIVAPRGLDELRRLAGGLFGAIGDNKAPVEVGLRSRSCWRDTPGLSFHFDRWQNTWVCVVNSADDAKVVTRLAADVLSHHLGGGQHSQMFERFRRGSSVAYKATTNYDSWRDHTSITSFVSVNKKSVRDVLKFLLERTQQFSEDGIDAEQLKCLIERVRRWWEMRMENHQHLADFLAFEALRPEGTSMVDFRPDSDTLEATMMADFSAAAGRVFDARNRRVFIGGRVGPLGRWSIRKELSSFTGRYL